MSKPPRRKRSIWDAAPLAETPHEISFDRLPVPEDDDPVSKSTFADLDGVMREAAKFGSGLLGFLLWMDSKFVQAGQPTLSPWWRHTLSEFFRSGKIWGLYRVGRGGGKSTSLVRVAILYVLFGCLFAERKVPPGQRWIWPFISAHTNDAARRITEATALLRALGIETKPKGHAGSRTIEMVDVNGGDVAFVSLAATIAGVSGPSALGGTVDEEAKLRDRAHNANPATEIIASIAQMFRARPGVHAIRCSSAWAEEGSHYAAIEEGETDATFVARLGAQFVDAAVAGLTDVAKWEAAHGSDDAARAIYEYAQTVTADSPNVPTWIANPTISALASRAQAEAMPVDATEGNRPRWRIWLRENASVPMPLGAGDGGTLSVDELVALGAANRRLAGAARGRGAGTFREDGLITVPGYGIDFKPLPKGSGGKGRL